MMMPRLMLLHKLILLGIWQCCFADENGMKMLEPFIGHQAGIALKADNDEYIGRVDIPQVDGHSGISSYDPVYEFKTHKTRLQVFQDQYQSANMDDYNMYTWNAYVTGIITPGKVIFIGEDGRPLCLFQTEHSGHDKLWLHTHPIEILQETGRKWCEFTPVASGSHITFEGHNGKYLKRFNVDDHDWIIADSSSPFDPFAKFLFESGAITQITEKIINVEWGTPPSDASDSAADIVMGTKYVNNCMDTDFTKEVTITKEYTTTETTSWDSSWSFTIGASYEQNFGLAALNIGSTLTISAEISYGQNDGAEISLTKTSTMTDSITMTIQPHTKMSFELVAKTFTDVPIPFTATIERTFDGITETVIQTGRWQAEIYATSQVRTNQMDLPDEDCTWGRCY